MSDKEQPEAPEVLPPSDTPPPGWGDQMPPVGRHRRSKKEKASRKEQEDTMSPEVALADMLTRGRRLDRLLPGAAKAVSSFFFQQRAFIESLRGEEDGLRRYVDALQVKVLELINKNGELQAELSQKSAPSAVMEGVNVAGAILEIPLVQKVTDKLSRWLDKDAPQLPGGEAKQLEAKAATDATEQGFPCPHCGKLITVEPEGEE